MLPTPGDDMGKLHYFLVFYCHVPSGVIARSVRIYRDLDKKQEGKSLKASHDKGLTSKPKKSLKPRYIKKTANPT
ncbi:MAG: hypothetical protein WBF90_10390 [Rivularia sp. (in: cyanobacteria)]